jgi:hypothetical protein
MRLPAELAAAAGNFARPSMPTIGLLAFKKETKNCFLWGPPTVWGPLCHCGAGQRIGPTVEVLAAQNVIGL